MKKPACIKCGSPMKKGWCVDETCPFSDSIRKREWLQHCKNVNDIIIHVPGFDPPIPNMKNKAIAKKVKAHIKKQEAIRKQKNKEYLMALKALVKELKKDAKRKAAEIEAFKKQLHGRKNA